MEHNILSALEQIDVASLSYEDWLRVGMALKREGYPCETWDSWSRNDGRYHPGECERKWRSFSEDHPSPVTGGTILKLAADRGWRSWESDGCLGWEDSVEYDGPDAPSPAPAVRPVSSLSPTEQLAAYLKALFLPSDIVGYVTGDVFHNGDGKYQPLKGVYKRTAGELLASLAACPNELNASVGDWREDTGAWIRINPLDGNGVKNANVTSFRYCLVESDTLPVEEQEARIRALQLPVAALVASGGKSVHAIVHIDAPDLEEYKARVSFLYDYLDAKGLAVDRQNRNPSRLSRMPGVTRNGRQQKLLGLHLGCRSWDEWRSALESGGAPGEDFYFLESFRDTLPELPEEMIEGVLRRGHKMLISGPSKAGKSFLLIELCVAFAEGVPWLGFRCRKSRVLYINLEIDPASCIRRFFRIYEALGLVPEHLGDIAVWNLRGKAKPLDRLVPDILERMKGQSFDVIVLDPIYKVITGDENNASDMGYFSNQFDILARETGCSVIYCHHHSKGVQGQKKAQDRASGSGVFARDPDAQLDMIQLELSEDLKNRVQDGCATAWRMESSLREFPAFPPRNFWFKYPLHVLDSENLANAPSEGSFEAVRLRNRNTSTAESRRESIFSAYDALSLSDVITVKDLAEYLGTSERTVRNHLKELSEEFSVKYGEVRRLAPKA